MTGTKANWWQTLLMVAIGAALPYLGNWIHDPGILAVISAVAMAGSNMLRSPLNDPPTVGPSVPSNPPQA